MASPIMQPKDTDVSHVGVNSSQTYTEFKSTSILGSITTRFRETIACMHVYLIPLTNGTLTTPQHPHPVTAKWIHGSRDTSVGEASRDT